MPLEKVKQMFDVEVVEVDENGDCPHCGWAIPKYLTVIGVALKSLCLEVVYACPHCELRIYKDMRAVLDASTSGYVSAITEAE